MTNFSKILVIGAWIIILSLGTGKAHRPTFPLDTVQESASVPSTPWLYWPLSHGLPSSTFTTSPEHVSITELLSHGTVYHQRLVVVRGVVTQPELHLDDSELIVNFVFRLADGDQSLVVFGRHNRTQGAPSISLDLSVEVVGVFWKDRDLDASHVSNTIEALTVSPYPSLIPDNA